MILSIITLLFVFILWHFLWKDYALDKLREDLFTIRNELFDIGCNKNEIHFNSRLFLTFERIINNTIRYGFKLSFMRAVIFSNIIKFKYPDYKIRSQIRIEFTNMMHNINDKNLKTSMEQLKRKYEVSVIKYFLRTSVLFFLTFACNIIFAILKHLFKKATYSILYDAKADTIDHFNKSLIKNVEYQAEELAAA